MNSGISKRAGRALGVSFLLSSAIIVPAVGSAQAQTAPAAAAEAATLPAVQQSYDIPSGDIGPALTRWAQASGVRLLASSKTLRGVRTQGVSGPYPAEGALQQLLKDTPLAYQFTGKRTVAILDTAAVRANAQSVELQTIDVQVDGTKDYVATRTVTGTKTSTPIIETPQSVFVVTREQMDQRVTQTPDEALRYSPGVSVAGKEDNRFDYASARGFSLVQYLDGLKLGTGSFAASQTEPYLLERIDILQGPASSLYGRSTPGGIIDMTSKRPTAKTINEVQLQTGSFQRKQVAVDLGGALNKEGTVLGRITAVARDADTQVNYVENQRIAIAPALTWRPSADTSLTLLTSYQNDPSGGLYGRLPAAGSLTPIAGYGMIPTDFFFGDRAFNSYERQQYSIGYQFEHRFNNNLSFRQNARYRHVDLDYKFLYATTYLTPTTLRRNVIVDSEQLDTYAIDNHFEAEAATGPLTHKILVGLDFHRNIWDYRNGVAAGAPTISLTNPNYYQTVTIPVFTNNLKQYQDQLGLYAQDQIKFGGLVLTLGGRQDRARTDQTNRNTNVDTTQSDSAFTGRAGLTYVFNNGIAPYVSYAESFEPTAGTDFFGNAFEPTTGTQYEGGIKYQPTTINALFTLAAFDIKQQNVLTADPDTSHGNAQVQTGEVRSRGLQASATASLAQGLNAVASYAILKNEVTKSNSGLVGTTPAGVPSHLASVWGDYTVQGGSMPGLNFGAGVRFFGKTYGDGANTFSVPSYTLVDAKIQYEFGKLNPSWKGLKLAIQFNNLFDKTYVAGCTTSTTCYYGFRRNVFATLTYRLQ